MPNDSIPKKHHECPFQGVITPNTNFSSSEFVGIDRRVGNVEQEITGLKVGMENLINQVSELANVVRNMANATKTNWATLATWAAVVLATMVYHSDLVMVPLRNNLVEQKENVSERLEMLDVAIKRELDLRDQLEQIRIQNCKNEKAKP